MMPGISPYRVGMGYDTHRFKLGNNIRLGGIDIPADVSLDGHSDADVLVHAIMDALLGAVGLGDIGDHFPPSDPTYKGIDSMHLLSRVVAMISEKGYEIINLDCVVLAEKPRLGKFKEEMAQHLAACFGIGADRVNIKATTNEKMGFVGRGEGIAAQAVVLLHEVGH